MYLFYLIRTSLSLHVLKGGMPNYRRPLLVLSIDLVNSDCPMWLIKFWNNHLPDKVLDKDLGFLCNGLLCQYPQTFIPLKGEYTRGSSPACGVRGSIPKKVKWLLVLVISLVFLKKKRKKNEELKIFIPLRFEK